MPYSGELSDGRFYLTEPGKNAYFGRSFGLNPQDEPVVAAGNHPAFGSSSSMTLSAQIDLKQYVENQCSGTGLLRSDGISAVVKGTPLFMGNYVDAVCQ
jgi:hypothetical protein